VRGDKSFSELYDGCYRRLVGELFVVLGSVAEAEDVVQDAFAQAYRRWGRISAYDEPAAWVRRVALNLASNRRRSLARRDVAVVRLSGGLGHEPELSAQLVELTAALRLLPIDQRVALMLHHVADLSVATIAAELGVPDGTVKARLSRGRAALRERLALDTEETSS
jgi:RNA polymerase sigma-70 factor (ECF subfamily)